MRVVTRIVLVRRRLISFNGLSLSLTTHLNVPVFSLFLMSLATLLLDPTTQSLLVAKKTAHQSVKMAPPSLEPITVVSPSKVNISILHDRSPTTVPSTTDSHLRTCPSSSKSSPSDPSHHPSPKCTPSLSRKRHSSGRQSSISYLPADSPRLWTPRTPQTGSDFLERSPLSGTGGKGVHARTQSVPFRAPSEPVVLTLTERYVLIPLTSKHHSFTEDKMKSTFLF